MSSHTITGTIRAIFDEVRRSENFNTREFVVTTDEDSQYPQHVILQLVNNNCDLIIGKHVGDKVDCWLNFKGRQWNGSADGVPRYYNTVECWRIFKNERE